MKTLGLIVNPIAGIGGRVGLKGSDGLEIQQRAREMGAVPQVFSRSTEALKRLVPFKDELEIVTYPAEMGQDVARACGLCPTVIGSIQPGATTPQDTQTAAQQMRRLDVDLILFAGGDGTARDLYNAIGDSVPALGIPAGVKIHSAVYAINPTSAGDLAALYLQGNVALREAEVMDLDEEAYRQGVVSPRLYGYLRIPFQKERVQARKSPSPPGESAACESIALAIVEQMQDDRLYVVGPGTTTRPILTRLGLEKTLIGVDALLGKQLVAADANEATLLGLVQGHPATLIVTPIGGQGYLFGRGNQQLSPAVIRAVGKENIVVVSAPGKIQSLRGQPFLVDTGDLEVDQLLVGYVKVVTSYDECIVYRVTASPWL
jgi:predicted polyphosphate/ATP-dependent NAD kinase